MEKLNINKKKEKTMEKKKNFSETFGAIAAYITVIGAVVMCLAPITNILFFERTSRVCNFVGLFGAAAVMLPLFIFQFIMTFGLLDRLGFQANLSFGGKVVFYLILFPFIDMWMVSTINAVFNFLPSLYGKFVVTSVALEQWWIAVIITYVTVIISGLLFRVIFSNKLKLKIA